MHTTRLRCVGGSVMLAVPPALLDVLDLGPGAEVGLSVEPGHLVVRPLRKPHYTLEALLAQTDPVAPSDLTDPEWTGSGAQGGELI